MKWVTNTDLAALVRLGDKAPAILQGVYWNSLCGIYQGFDNRTIPCSFICTTSKVNFEKWRKEHEK